MHKTQHNRVFRQALIFSVIFHLSMVTVFNIVILFPRQDITYYDFHFVKTSTSFQNMKFSTDRLHLSGLEKGYDGQMAMAGANPAGDILSSIQLPTLEFAELERLAVRQDSRSLMDRIQGPQSRDSWGRLGQGIEKVRLSLSRLGTQDDDSQDTLPALASPPQPVHRPAEGYEAYIEWSTAPKDRQLLFAPPIKALWDITAENLNKPIEIVFKVNQHGRVINVWSPVVDTDGIIDSVQIAVLKYKFASLETEPLNGEENTGKFLEEPGHLKLEGVRADGQTGTLYIRPAEASL
jgi:hypothetical protein